jgi:LysM repeat protein
MTRAARAVASLAVLAVLMVVAPLALAAASTQRFGSPNPLRGVRPPWHWLDGTIGRAAREPLDDDAVVDIIVRLGLVVIWVALAVVLVTTLGETFHLIRHRGFTMPSVRGLGWAQGVGRFIATGLILIGPLTSARSSIAAPQLSAPVPISMSVEYEPPPPATTRTDEGSDECSVIEVPADAHVVGRGESVYSIAARLARDDPALTVEIADAILDANLDTVMPDGQRFTNPAYIEPGWVLVIPDTGDPDAGDSDTGYPDAGDPDTGIPEAAPPDAAVADGTDPAGEHVVVVGETLSAIAAEHLGDPDEWPRIWDQNAGSTMVDGRTFDDPNLILPGWELDLPDAPGVPDDARSRADQEAPVTPPTVVATPDDLAAQAPANSTPTVERTGGIPGSTAASSASTTLASTASTTLASAPAPPSTGPAMVSTTSTSRAGATTTSSTVVPGSGSRSGAGDDAEPGSLGRSPLRIEHAAMLAAGILGLVGLRRRHRLRAARPRSRVPEPSGEVADTERRLRRSDPGERATRVDVALRAAADDLSDGAVQIGLVAVAPDGDIELRLTGDAELSTPWSGSGAAWTLPATVPIEMLAEPARRVGAPCVAFVQIGVTPDGADVLIDLEASGLLTVEAESELTDPIVTAVAAGLAGSIYAEVAHLITVSLPEAATLGHRNAHRAESVDAALELAADLTGSTQSNDETTFTLRCRRTGGEIWEPAVLLTSSVEGADWARVARSLPAAFPPAGHGLAVVAAIRPDASVSSDNRLVACAAGWVLEAFGCSTELTPIGLPPEDLAAMIDLLDDAAAPLEDEPIGDGGPFVPSEHDIVVGLMGPVTITDVTGHSGEFERSKTVELIAWLATHRENSTRLAARTALWELDVRDATFANVVSEARRGLARLVVPRDGVEWLERTLNEQLPLHAGVVTDADLIRERVRIATLEPPAQAIETLRPAVELIRDAPFAGTAYLWPDAEGLTSNLVLLATGVSAELAAHGLSTDDIELVFWSTARGLKVLPGHEELIGLRMKAHARAGDLAGVRCEWEAYERVIVADAWSDGEPAPKLLALRRKLLDVRH